MFSKITGGNTTLIFTSKVLNKYPVKYYSCNETGFIQTEEPYWLEEAYSSAITKLDIGLPHRNMLLSDSVEKILLKNFNCDGMFLDYAGGYGLFTRFMRDKGFNFYNTDKYCENIFAEYFDLTDIDTKKFELITSFEVLEHLTNPYKELEEIFSYTDSLLFTTELQPQKKLLSVDDWWYFIPETGQHIAFYTQESLAFIAKKLGYNFYTNGTDWHLFTKKTFDKNPFVNEREPFFVRKARKFLKKNDAKKYPNRETLLQKDWAYIKSKL